MTPKSGHAVFFYSAYGLGIRSDIELPELARAVIAEDFTIRVDPSGDPVQDRGIEWQDGYACFSYPRLARFEVREGRELTITPDPAGDPSVFRLYVQGMMLASALYQRGLFVLHASVVEVDGSAVAFMGPVGAGKSTFASAFCALGRRVVADDNAAIDLDAASPRVLPAYPSLKVYPDVACSLGVERSRLQPMHASQVKESQPLHGAFAQSPLPLRAIYVLDRGAANVPSPLAPVESLTELVRHSVPTRWAVPGDGRHLSLCGRVAKSVPMFRARTFRELHEIPALAAAIEKHASRA